MMILNSRERFQAVASARNEPTRRDEPRFRSSELAMSAGPCTFKVSSVIDRAPFKSQHENKYGAMQAKTAPMTALYATEVSNRWVEVTDRQYLV
ncbi:hypothetical protein D3C87_1809140 [compost metagenome]